MSHRLHRYVDKGTVSIAFLKSLLHTWCKLELDKLELVHVASCTRGSMINVGGNMMDLSMSLY